jgi:heat-inducible transcriptional repressor
LSTLPRRQREVLQATVRHYVDTVEPVGSKTLVRRFGMPASPATVRSAMGALEQRGLLTQPHTSAGRIPSQLGYRLYVDQLLPAPGAAAQQLNRELTGLSLQWASLDDLLLHLARRLADLTGLMSLITRPRRPSSSLRAIRLVPSGDRLLVLLVHEPARTTSLNLRLPKGTESELPILERWTNTHLRACPDDPIPWQRIPAELRLSGGLLRRAIDSQASRVPQSGEDVLAVGLGGLLAQPEFSLTSSLLPLVRLIENTPEQVLVPPDDAISIGSEHPEPALEHCAVVQAAYHAAEGSTGRVALVGPMRMAYATAKAAVRSVASVLERLLS